VAGIRGWRRVGSPGTGWPLGWLMLTAGLGGLLAGSVPGSAGGPATVRTATARTPIPGTPAPNTPAAGAACGAFRGAHQLPGADGVTPAAWSGDGLAVPACGPVPGEGTRAAAVYAYPGAQWTPGYQCVEFSERYLHDRYGISMNVPTNGDQVAAHYAADFPGLFTLVRNGAPHLAPRAGDVLSLSNAPGFDSASGGHTAVVQSGSVNAAGNGTVTVVEENGSPSGVAVLAVTAWTVRYPGFRYLEWLTVTGQPVIRRMTSESVDKLTFFYEIS
jgi:CHAP domain